MNAIEEAVKELVNDLLPTLQAADSRGVAILRLLKDKGIVSDDELAPYLEQAANASSVKERAARVRFEHLIASAIKGVRELAQQTAAKVVEEGPANRRKARPPKRQVSKAVKRINTPRSHKPSLNREPPLHSRPAMNVNQKSLNLTQQTEIRQLRAPLYFFGGC